MSRRKQPMTLRLLQFNQEPDFLWRGGAVPQKIWFLILLHFSNLVLTEHLLIFDFHVPDAQPRENRDRLILENSDNRE